MNRPSSPLASRLVPSLAVMIAAAVPRGHAQSVEFSANHVFVSEFLGRQVLEFDESGTFVRAIDVGSGANITPTGMVFAPDGLLRVGSALTSEIVALDGSGEVQSTISNGAILNVEAIELDTIGRPLVTSFNYGDLVLLTPDGTSSAQLYDGSTPLYDLEIDDSGFVVTSAGALGHSKYFDIDGSNPLTNSASLALAPPASNPHGIAIEFGNTAVVGDAANARAVFGTTWFGSAPDPVSIPLASNSIEDVDFAPDGRLFVVDALNAKILAVDRDGNAEEFATATGGSEYLVYLAIAPFRFDTIVRGRVRNGSGEMVQILENAVVSVQPASRRVMFHFTDDPLDANDFVSVTGLDRFVANGKVTGFDAPGPSRSFHARAPRDNKARNDITVTCDTKRKFDEHGFERVISASGALWCGGSSTQIHLTYKTKKVLNP